MESLSQFRRRETLFQLGSEFQRNHQPSIRLRRESMGIACNWQRTGASRTSADYADALNC
jgi:hypothetical protein